MEFDILRSAVVFVAIVALGAAALIAAPMIPMDTSTILMMVVPSMVVYGLIMFVLGVKHGEYRESGLGLSLR